MRFAPLIAVALVAALAVAVASVNASPIRETESPTNYFLHFPIKPELLKPFVHPPLIPHVYEDGNAYVQIAYFHIAKLETQLFGRFFSIGADGDCTRTSIFVYDPVKKQPGYMIISADFAKTLGGIVEAIGCKFTNPMECGVANIKISQTELTTAISGHAEQYYKFNIKEQAAEFTNQKFYKWSMIDRPFRWAQSRKISDPVDERPSTGKDGPENMNWKEIKPVEINSWSSTLLTSRFGAATFTGVEKTPATSLCKSQTCFTTKHFIFVDGDAHKLAGSGAAGAKFRSRLNRLSRGGSSANSEFDFLVEADANAEADAEADADAVADADADATEHAEAETETENKIEAEANEE